MPFRQESRIKSFDLPTKVLMFQRWRIISEVAVMNLLTVISRP